MCSMEDAHQILTYQPMDVPWISGMASEEHRRDHRVSVDRSRPPPFARPASFWEQRPVSARSHSPPTVLLRGPGHAGLGKGQSPVALMPRGREGVGLATHKLRVHASTGTGTGTHLQPPNMGSGTETEEGRWAGSTKRRTVPAHTHATGEGLHGAGSSSNKERTASDLTRLLCLRGFGWNMGHGAASE